MNHWEDKTSSPSKTSVKINDIINNYEKYPSICDIKKNRSISKFSFRSDSVEEVKKITRDLKTNIALSGETPTKILKECKFTFIIVTKCVNKSIETGFC